MYFYNIVKGSTLELEPIVQYINSIIDKAEYAHAKSLYLHYCKGKESIILAYTCMLKVSFRSGR